MYNCDHINFERRVRQTENPYIDLIKQALKERGAARTQFAGRSMLPTLCDGMQVMVESLPPENVRPADIVLYRKENIAVIHRVVRVLSQGSKRVFLTKGDNQAYIDCYSVPEGDLIGVVRGAFYERAPGGEDVLMKNRAVGLLYVIMGRMALFAMNKRERIPLSIRRVFRHPVGGLFLMFKRFIHFCSGRY